MVIQKNCEFVTEVSAPTTSIIFPNSTGDILTLQISCDEGVYSIEGRNNNKTDAWFPLAGISLSDFSVVKGGFKKAGMYDIGIAGVRELRARVESVNGSVSLFGQIISAEET